MAPLASWKVPVAYVPLLLFTGGWYGFVPMPPSQNVLAYSSDTLRMFSGSFTSTGPSRLLCLGGFGYASHSERSQYPRAYCLGSTGWIKRWRNFCHVHSSPSFLRKHIYNAQ